MSHSSADNSSADPPAGTRSRLTDDVSDAEWRELMQRLIENDDAQVRAFHDRIRPALLGIADRRIADHLRPRFDAEDVVQSVFRSFFRRAQAGSLRLDDSDRLWSLLCAITLTKVRERARFHGRERRRAARDVSDDGHGFVDERRPADELTDFRDEFDTLVSSLDDVSQSIIDRKLNGQTDAAIAEDMGISQRSVERLTQRLRTRLQGMFRND